MNSSFFNVDNGWTCSCKVKLHMWSCWNIIFWHGSVMCDIFYFPLSQIIKTQHLTWNCWEKMKTIWSQSNSNNFRHINNLMKHCFVYRYKYFIVWLYIQLYTFTFLLVRANEIPWREILLLSQYYSLLDLYIYK